MTAIIEPKKQEPMKLPIQIDNLKRFGRDRRAFMKTEEASNRKNNHETKYVAT